MNERAILWLIAAVVAVLVVVGLVMSGGNVCDSGADVLPVCAGQ